MTRQQLISAIAKAIAKMEGFYVNGSVASRNNNPGNLRSWPGVPTNKGFATFPSAEAGWQALHMQVESNVWGRGKRDPWPKRADGLTLREFFGGQDGGYPGYAPSNDGNKPEHYARFVASQIGVDDIDVKIKTFVTE